MPRQPTTYALQDNTATMRVAFPLFRTTVPLEHTCLILGQKLSVTASLASLDTNAKLKPLSHQPLVNPDIIAWKELEFLHLNVLLEISVPSPQSTKCLANGVNTLASLVRPFVCHVQLEPTVQVVVLLSFRLYYRLLL